MLWFEPATSLMRVSSHNHSTRAHSKLICLLLICSILVRWLWVRFFIKWAIPGFFFLYFCLFSTVDSKQMFDKSWPVTGLEPQISGVRGNCSNNWATTNAPEWVFTTRLYISLINIKPFFKPHSHPTGVPMLMDPHPSQQHACLQHAVWQPQQEVTRPKARFRQSNILFNLSYGILSLYLNMVLSVMN